MTSGALKMSETLCELEKYKRFYGYMSEVRNNEWPNKNIWQIWTVPRYKV